MTHLARNPNGLQYVFILTEISRGQDRTFQACKTTSAFTSSNPSSSLLLLRCCIRSFAAQCQLGTKWIKMRSHQSAYPRTVLFQPITRSNSLALPKVQAVQHCMEMTSPCQAHSQISNKAAILQQQLT